MSSRVLKLIRDHAKNEHYHPLCALYDLASEHDATITDAINIHKTIAKYCEAENKAIEISQTRTDDRFRLNVILDQPSVAEAEYVE